MNQVSMSLEQSIRTLASREQTEFLSWKLTPARLNATQAAWFLGFEPHEIAILVG